jgi:polyisoprenoid-binding protein YceI
LLPHKEDPVQQAAGTRTIPFGLPRALAEQAVAYGGYKQMKSLIGRIKSGFLTTSLSIALFAIISPAAYAAGGKWSLDSAASDARFFQGSAANPDSTNPGTARVTGQVNLNPDDLNHSAVDLSIYPADENWGHALDAQGILPTGYVPDATDHTLLTFKSTHIWRTTDGKLEVMGNLTLTQVERSVTLTPGEGYAGPLYGDPVIQAETREIIFLFPTLRAQSELDISGSAAGIGRENFPELFTAIKTTNWPSVVKDETCAMPPTAGEDYSGAQCTGTVIAETRNNNCQMPAMVGEDYSGALCSPPAGDQMTIVLDLKLLPDGFQPSTDSGSAVGQ